MKLSLNEKIAAFWATLISIGIYNSDDIGAQQRTRIIDIVAFLCLPILAIYGTIAYLTSHYYLFTFYVGISLLMLLLVYGNYTKKKEGFRLAVIFLVTLMCAIANVLFDNGQGYYILLISFLTLLYYGMRKDMFYLSLFYLALYFISEIIKLKVNTIEPVVFYIRVIKIGNIFIAVSFFVYFLYDTKRNYIKALKDILVEKKRAEKYANQQLKLAQRLKVRQKKIIDLKNKNEELSSIVYHQMRSPVATFSDMLSQYLTYESFSKEDFTNVTKLLKKKVDATLNIVDNLLMWNQKGIDGVQPNAFNIELNPLINKALEQLSDLLDEKKLKITYPESVNLKAYADPNHIFIILLNVFTNAIKFSPPGKIITLNFVELNNKCRLYISNLGRGIEADRIKFILSAEPVISEKGTFNETGTGMGLKICKNLVEKNKGTFEINSGLNKKTTVVIELPAAM